MKVEKRQTSAPSPWQQDPRRFLGLRHAVHASEPASGPIPARRAHLGGNGLDEALLLGGPVLVEDVLCDALDMLALEGLDENRLFDPAPDRPALFEILLLDRTLLGEVAVHVALGELGHDLGAGVPEHFKRLGPVLPVAALGLGLLVHVPVCLGLNQHAYCESLVFGRKRLGLVLGHTGPENEFLGVAGVCCLLFEVDQVDFHVRFCGRCFDLSLDQAGVMSGVDGKAQAGEMLV